VRAASKPQPGVWVGGSSGRAILAGTAACLEPQRAAEVAPSGDVCYEARYDREGTGLATNPADVPLMTEPSDSGPTV
jgi:hypothetical protein